MTTSTTAGGSDPAGIVVTSDGGVSWKRQLANLNGSSILSAVSCPTVRSCMAVGETTPSATSSPAASSTGAAATQLQGAVVVTGDGGATWQSMSAPEGAADLVGVQCSTGAACTALATDGATFWTVTTLDGGQVWQRGGTLPAGISGVSSLFCTSGGDCLVAGYTSSTPGHGAGAIDQSNDGGKTWAAATLPSGVGLLHGVSCTTGGSCIAVGTTSTLTSDVEKAAGAVLVSPDGGTTWTRQLPPRTVDDGFAVSCAGSSCAMVGIEWTIGLPPAPVGGVATTLTAGASWLTPELEYVPAGLVAVDCGTAASCVAVGSDVVARMALPAPRAAAPPTRNANS